MYKRDWYFVRNIPKYVSFALSPVIPSLTLRGIAKKHATSNPNAQKTNFHFNLVK